jgi:hypothetical protein
MKIAPKTVEKRLKRFAHAIKHDETHCYYTFDHRGPWYRQRNRYSRTYGAARDGVLAEICFEDF